MVHYRSEFAWQSATPDWLSDGNPQWQSPLKSRSGIEPSGYLGTYQRARFIEFLSDKIIDSTRNIRSVYTSFEGKILGRHDALSSLRCNAINSSSERPPPMCINHLLPDISHRTECWPVSKRATRAAVCDSPLVRTIRIEERLLSSFVRVQL